jgi:ribosomal protein S7
MRPSIKLNEKSDSVDPLELFNRAIENAKPKVEVKARRVGGATYQVPLEVAPARSESLAMRWIVGYARGRKGQPMHRALANELKEASQGQGSAVRKRDDVHKQAQANRAFAHFRFYPRPTPSPIFGPPNLFFRPPCPIRTPPTASSLWSAPATSGSAPTLTRARRL